MNDATQRRRRRKRLYLAGLVPSLLLLMVSGRIVFLLQQQAEAMSAYAAGDFDRARDAFEVNQVLNPIERWVAPFGEGDARYRAADYDGAVAAFEVALELVPEDHECIVRLNLALAHEARGDTLLEDDNRTEALDAWLEGRQVVRPCKELAEQLAEEQREESEDEDEDARDRDRRDRRSDDDPRLDDVGRDRDELEDRSRAAAVRVDARLARKLGIDDRPRAPKPDEAPPEDETTREKQRRLEERNKKALSDNVKHKDEFDMDPDPTPPPPEPTPQW